MTARSEKDLEQQVREAVQGGTARCEQRRKRSCMRGELLREWLRRKRCHTRVAAQEKTYHTSEAAQKEIGYVQSSAGGVVRRAVEEELRAERRRKGIAIRRRRAARRRRRTHEVKLMERAVRLVEGKYFMKLFKEEVCEACRQRRMT